MLKKGDLRKAALAVRIHTRTAVPNAWIAELLYLGHVSRVNRGAPRPARTTERIGESPQTMTEFSILKLTTKLTPLPAHHHRDDIRARKCVPKAHFGNQEKCQ